MADSIFGKDGVLYWSAALKTDYDDAGELDWVEQENVIDVTDNFGSTDVDSTTRGTAKRGWEASESILNSGEIKFNMKVLHGNTFVDAILSAAINKTKVALMDMSSASDVEGAFGLAANFAISFTHAKPVKGIQTIDITAKVSSFPEWVVSEGS
jgi:hypothetical protein